jgi:hydrogenase nickel incorporation protein HypA/HybF
MHEMSLAEGMLQLVEDGARRNAAHAVKAVRLEIGALAKVEVDALRFCFDAVTHGTLAEGARLEIVATPGAAWCMPCGERVAIARLGDACPRCGSYQLQVVAGEAMRVVEIEIV